MPKHLKISLEKIANASNLSTWLIHDFEEKFGRYHDDNKIQKRVAVKEAFCRVIKESSYKCSDRTIKISNQAFKETDTSINSSLLIKFCKELGLVPATSCRQPDMKYGRGWVVPKQLLQIN